MPRDTERNALVIAAALIALGKLVVNGADNPGIAGITEQVIWHLAAFFLFVAFVSFWAYLKEEYNISNPLGLPISDHRFLYSFALTMGIALLILLANT